MHVIYLLRRYLALKLNTPRNMIYIIYTNRIVKTLFQATWLFILIVIWVISLWSNEFRQLYLRKKRYFESASLITGNILELLALLLFVFGIGFHCASFDHLGVILPLLYDEDFKYCSFQLKGSLVWAQDGFRK